MTVGMGGSTPQYDQSGMTPGQKALFHSLRDIALIIDKTAKAGYGYLQAGTLMCVNSADGLLVPYPETDADVNGANAKAYLSADSGAVASTLSVLASESYKFAVDDVLIIVDDTTPAEDLGVITGIVISETTGLATITVTTATGATSFTTARDAHVYLKADASTPFTKAIYIMDQDVFTGDGESALGANVSVVVSNAVLYTAALPNSDAAALTDLGAIVDGRFTILK